MPTTIVYDRGAVVLLPFPFSDQSSAKIRPAIVANPLYPSDDLLVIAVSSVAGTLRPGEFSIQFWREAGLIHPSFCKRAIASVSANLVRKQIGKLHQADLPSLNAAIRLWFGL
jgi:mRNA interferase MazF